MERADPQSPLPPTLQVAQACEQWLRPHPVAPIEGAPHQPGGGRSVAPCWLLTLPANGASSSSGEEEGGARCLPLSTWEQLGGALMAPLGEEGGGKDGCLLAFSDPSSHESSPGWPLRNLLLLVAVHMKLRSVKVGAHLSRSLPSLSLPWPLPTFFTFTPPHTHTPTHTSSSIHTRFPLHTHSRSYVCVSRPLAAWTPPAAC